MVYVYFNILHEVGFWVHQYNVQFKTMIPMAKVSPSAFRHFQNDYVANSAGTGSHVWASHSLLCNFAFCEDSYPAGMGAHFLAPSHSRQLLLGEPDHDSPQCSALRIKHRQLRSIMSPS